MIVRLSTGTRNALANAFDTTYANCTIHIYSGTQPTSANDAETGTLLAKITESGGTFTGGSATNGLNFDSASGGVISKASGETWQGTGLAAGVATWARIYDNAYTTGASTSANRVDVDVATSGAALVMATTTISVGGTVTIDSATVTQPAS